MGKKNLAYQKKVIIGNTVPIEHCYAALEKGSKDVLTDGITGDPASCYSGDWAHFYRGVGRTLTVDLGGEFAVSGMDIGFIQDKNMGIYSPETVKLLLSVNGVDFYEVSSVDSPYPASFEQKVRAVYSSELSKPLRARYARVDFFVEVNSFCDELRVFGDACDGETQELTGEAVKEEYVGSYESNDCLGGIRDVCLMYFGYWPENERTARLTKEDFMPYLAYVDRNGKIIDTMFDGSMFLMVMGKCPSGGSLGYHGGPSFLSDWEYILNELFTSGQNLSAINEAYGEVKKSLGLPKEAKHKIYLTAPVPKISLEPFGDMNGDGIEEKILSTDDCIAAYAWYVDEFTRRFKAQQYENIEVDGWFWNNESASRAARDDEEYFAAGCVAELHKRGYKCVMIPYFQAGGTEKARKIGFDCITMQPGLSFQEALGVNAEGMMEDFTELCKKYGFGIELEMHHGVNNDEQKYKYGKLFDEYLRACIKNGMMTDTVHTYYQAAGPGAFYRCAVSEDDYQRNMYDKLYKFIKGTLTENDLDGIENSKATDIKEVKTEAVKADDAQTDYCDSCVTLDEPENEEICCDNVFEPDFEEELEFDIPKRKKIRKLTKQERKNLAIAGGIAALLGTAYLIYKAAKGRDNEIKTPVTVKGADTFFVCSFLRYIYGVNAI